MSNIIDSLARLQAYTSAIYGHIGFTLALRRELLPMLQTCPRGDPTPFNWVMGTQIIESEHIPPGHFMVNGVSYRYTKPTLDEMVAEAQKRLLSFIDDRAVSHFIDTACDFYIARRRLGVLS